MPAADRKGTVKFSVITPFGRDEKDQTVRCR